MRGKAEGGETERGTSAARKTNESLVGIIAHSVVAISINFVFVL